jgi:hypothetical protein
VATRRTFRGGLDSLTETTQARGWDFGAVGIWVGRNRNALRIGVLVGAFLVLLIWSQPTAWVVLGLALIVALLLLLVELLGRAPPGGEETSRGEPHEPGTRAEPTEPATPMSTGADEMHVGASSRATEVPRE